MMSCTNENLLDVLQDALDSKDEQKVAQIIHNRQLRTAEVQQFKPGLLRGLNKLSNDQLTVIFLEVLAEWSTEASNRIILENKETMDLLIKLLQHPNQEIVLNCVRILGNLCYENESAQLKVGREGLTIVIEILRNAVKHGSDVLSQKTTGFLLNLLSSSEDLEKASLELGILPVIYELLLKYIDSFEHNLTLYIFLLTILSNVLLYIDDMKIKLPEDLFMCVIRIFKMSDCLDIQVLCFEILHDEIEKDYNKVLLAENGVCEHMIDLIEKHQTEVTNEVERAFMKSTCNDLVVILTEDESMHVLYGKGEGQVYRKMIEWLDSKNADLLSTAVLAMGNFGRKDVHCKEMVQDGVSTKLISLLSEYNQLDSDVRVQHALLSTLKNLAILSANKPKLLQDGIIDVVYPLVESQQSVVVFKLLGLFRIVIEGQESAALDLISRKDFIDKLILWYDRLEHLEVRSEVPRLLSWLIKYCHSSLPYQYLIETKGALKSLVEMISSNHALMQNEAFYTFNVMIAGSDANLRSKLFDELISLKIGQHLNFVLKKYADEMNEGAVNNLLSLIEALITDLRMIDHLTDHNLMVSCTQLMTESNAADIQERINNIVQNWK